ncbi:MAG: hypothetical protein R6X33_05685 [Candidatus Brocadiia bacterium]
MSLPGKIVTCCNWLVRVVPVLVLADMAVLIGAVTWGPADGQSLLVPACAVLLVPLVVLWLVAFALADLPAKLSRSSLVFAWLAISSAAGRLFSPPVRRDVVPVSDGYAALLLALIVFLVGAGLWSVRSRALEGSAPGSEQHHA